MEFNTSLYLDKRKSSKKTSSLFPVKLRVYSSLTKKANLYPTGIDLSIDDFKEIFHTDIKVRGIKKEAKIYLNEFENKSEKIASKLSPFLFSTFEKKMFRSKTASISVEYHYKNKIALLDKNNQVGTSSNYDLSLKSLNNYIKYSNNGKLNKLTFFDITYEWLYSYETYMVNTLNRSLTTVSMYLRALRTIFNDAISENDITQEIYPFGKSKGKYQVPKTTKVKKALSKEELKILYNAKPLTKEQDYAKAFWFFSYACSGMNIKDIALLKFKNLNSTSIHYFRSKTLNTKRANLKEINVVLNEYAHGIIKKYGSENNSPKQLIFSIINIDDDPKEQKRKIKNFTSFVNLHFNKLAKSEGFDFKVTSYWARHSFATNSIRNGASKEFISDALNHSSMKVTDNYFAGFEDDVKKEFANSLMDF